MKMMIRYLILICFLPFNLSLLAKNVVDYQNKRLLSHLKKNGVSEFSSLKEINNLPETISKYGKFYKVDKNVGNEKVRFVFVGRVNSCRTGGCDEKMSEENLESEYFDYFIFFDESKSVRLVEVFNYQATHGYEVTARGWLKQFVGFSGNDTLIVNKDIDGITGATISVYAITLDVQEKTKILKSMK